MKYVFIIEFFTHFITLLLGEELVSSSSIVFQRKHKSEFIRIRFSREPTTDFSDIPKNGIT